MKLVAVTAATYAEQNLLVATQIVAALAPGQVTTAGNQNALGNFLSQAVQFTQKGEPQKAIDKLNHAIARTDGCERNGVADGNGPGRDWITDCNAQAQVLVYLRAVSAALATP